MELFSSRHEISNRPVLIRDGQELAAIIEFFETFELSEAKQFLWNWFEAALITESGLFDAPEERSNLVVFYQKLQ